MRAVISTLQSVLSKRTRLMACAAVVSLLAIAYFATTARWNSRAVIVLSGEAVDVSPSALTSLAASAGLGGLATSTPLELVRTLALDEEIHRMLVTRTVPTSEGDGIVATIVGAQAPVDGDSRDGAARKLKDNLTVSLDVAAQTIEISVRVRDSVSARPLLEQLLAVLDSVHRDSKSRQAAATRRFMEGQTALARARLDSSETVLERFLEVNRTISTPRLQLQSARLQRLVELDRQWAQAMDYQLSQAVFAEARNTPVLVAAIPATDPLVSDKSRVRRGIVLALAFLVAAASLLWIGVPKAIELLDQQSSL